MQAKTGRFEMRLPEELIERVDAWRSDQDDVPSRAEAMRRLVEIGLSRSPDSRDDVHVSDGEKLILFMLSDLYRFLEIPDESEMDPKFISEALLGGHYWGLAWKYSGIFHGHRDDRRKVSDVVNILDMWYFIESGYEKLSLKEQDRIATDVGPLGKHVRFLGFDGNNESEYMGIAHFLVNALDRFTIFQGRDLNSHCPVLESYHRMLTVFESMRTGLAGRELGADEIIKLLNARKI